MARTETLEREFEHVLDASPRQSELDRAKERLSNSLRGASRSRVSFKPWALSIPEPKFGTLNFRAFPFQEALYTDEVAYAEQVVLMKCLAPETPVLTADLRWVPIESLKPGDEMVGLDEEIVDCGSGKKRRLRKAVVEDVWENFEPAFKVTLHDGRTITATSEHRFLTHRGGRNCWRTLAELGVGGSIRRVLDVWGDPTYEDGWMGGLIDGEGSLQSRRPQGGSALVITQAVGRVVDRAADYLSDGGYKFHISDREPLPHQNLVVRKLALSRVADMLRLVGKTRPTKYVSSGWWEGHGLPRDGNTWLKIVAVEPLGVRRMIDIRTSTGTFIAEGMANHNCSQVGASAWLARAAMFWPDTRGKTALYVMPNEKTLTKFSQQRIAVLIRESKYLRSRVPHDNVNNVMQRQIGSGFFNMTGSNSEAGLESVDADVLALDEYDLLVQANVPRAEKRVSGPLSLGLIRRIGFPTVPGYGIAKKYAESDKRTWQVKCSGCGLVQEIDFWKNVDQERMLRVCRDCREPLDVRTGEWIAEFPDRDIPGFHLSRLIVPNANIPAIVAESKGRAPYEVQEFWNRTLGLPFADSSQSITDAVLQAATREYVMVDAYTGDNLVTAGIDVASVRNLNVRISEHLSDNTRRALWIGECETFDDVAELMDRFRVKMACIDHLPEGRLARGFADRFAGRVYVLHYSGTQKDVLTIDDDQRTVSVRRTDAMDATIHVMKSQRNLIPLNVPAGYADQMKAPVRFVERDELGRVVVGFRSMGPDDYFHAETFDLVATECFYIRLSVEAASEETVSQLDDHFEFKRSHLTEVDEEEGYAPGPDEGDWSGIDQEAFTDIDGFDVDF